MSSNVVACILAGGEGRRMLPLTAHRAKPAVRFACSYRLIDFPLSNCLNSGIHEILIFPQYKALSLYRHLRRGWSFLNRECGEYIKALPPQRRPGDSWYRGTADAIYQNLSTLDRIAPADVLILAGDHVYQMDYRPLLQYHRDSHAEATVATFPVPRQLASQFGILTKDRFGQVISFVEKPKDTEVPPSKAASVLASMGIYVFQYKVLREVLAKNAHMQPAHDFGGDVLPNMLDRHRLMVFPFVEGVDKGPAYWRDVGTIDAFWEAHMDLLGPPPRFRLHQPNWPLVTAPEQGPPMIILTSSDRVSDREGRITNTLIAQGCLLQGGRIDRAVLSPEVWIEPEADVQESILFDGVHIGRGAQVRRAILDRGTVIAPGARIGYDPIADGEEFSVSEKGITVVGSTPARRPIHQYTA